jgi:hypothetical protein
LIAALSLTADMVGILLKQLDLLLDARHNGRAVTDTEAAQIREHVTIWRAQLGQVALATHRPDDRAADNGAVT